MVKTLENKKNKGLFIILTGIALFALRYVPLLNYDTLLVNEWYSISQAASICGGFFGGVVSECSWVNPLNVVVIIIAVLLIGYGAYLVYQEQKK